MTAAPLDLRAVATAAENVASVIRRAATEDRFDRPDLGMLAHGWEHFAAELREIANGETGIHPI